ncbi:DUF1707 domain-containing protein [Actinokineospora guangxiensis]|uniref:DUF1707 domain-containing protein n=1 Tax=Actinokineospora guangxiensis TaxID=1490288 RepID=A0ABW0EWD5_9PSEU
MARDADIRIGTEDRERAVALLSDHFAAGRIDVGEYEQRCAVATAARTRGDIVAVFDDLPKPHPAFTDDDPGDASPDTPEDPDESDQIVPAPRREVLQRAVKRRTNNLIIGGFVLASLGAIVTVTAITGSWWALAPALLVALVLVAVIS